MSINISSGVSDTAITGVSAPTLNLPLINFKSDYRVKSNTPKEVKLSNTVAPLDQSETIRFSYSEMANIYANSELNSDQIPGSTKGISLLAQVNQILKVSDSTNAAFMQYLPVSAYMVIKVPKSGYITPDIVRSLIARLNASLYENGSSNLNAMLKGVITPASL